MTKTTVPSDSHPQGVLVKKRVLGVLAQSLLGLLCGCAAPIHFVKLDAALPSVAAVGTGKRVYVDAFQDARKNILREEAEISQCGSRTLALTGAYCGKSSIPGASPCLPGQAHQDGECLEDQDPANLIRNAFSSLLEADGFELLKDRSLVTENDFVVVGTVTDFFVESVDHRVQNGESFSGLSSVVTCHLAFSRNGETVASQEIHATTLDPVGAGKPDLAVASLNKSLQDLLGQTAAYLQSAAFKDKVVNLAPVVFQEEKDLGDDPKITADEDEE